LAVVDAAAAAKRAATVAAAPKRAIARLSVCAWHPLGAELVGELVQMVVDLFEQAQPRRAPDTQLAVELVEVGADRHARLMRRRP
jgi:hypothetical protein